MPRKGILIAFLAGWALSLVISPKTLLGMVRAKAPKAAY
jgi:hypothetical protein